MKHAVYILYHFKISLNDVINENDMSKDPKFIGIYSTKANAEAAIERLKDKFGFKLWPGGFRIFDHEIDKTDWQAGFDNR